VKQPWEWNEDDLLSLITNGTKESIELDYKACDALAQTDGKKNEISKDISAFANSAGGAIVYGMLENGHVPLRLDSDFDPSVISKEWLEQVINSRIHRRIDGIRINQVELIKTNVGKVVYVVCIPQSDRAPHQAADKRFYKRFNFESVPMEEYEVRDVAHRVDAPDLSLKAFLVDCPTPIQFDENVTISSPIKFNMSIGNQSTVPAMYYIVSLYIDKKLKALSMADFHTSLDQQLLIRNTAISVSAYSKNFAVPSNMPIWQGVDLRIGNPHFKISVPSINDCDYAIGWSIDSPGMQRKMGFAILRILQGIATIVMPST